MLKHRVIPSLLIRNGGLVKTTQFANPRYVGDPLNAIRIFNEKEVDEILVLDIMASKEGREPDFAMIEEFSGECFMPLCYGGGISSIAQAERLFSLGVEKLSLQAATFSNLNLITEIATRFGSQAIVASIDIKVNWRGQPQLYEAASGAVHQGWQNHLARVVDAGAGEVLLTAVDRDGMMKGVDTKLIEAASQAVGVPLIACGGVGSLADIKAAVQAGASAVAAGAFFVFQGKHRAVLITYPNYTTLEDLLAAT
jgi:cyclase